MREFTNLSKYLKNKRIEAGLTQKSLARLLGGMDTQFVSNWERGLCSPPSHVFGKMIEVLKINREKLVEIMLKDSLLVIESKVFKKVPKRKK